MSDVESSIMSEDISMATDGSEAYDPRANQYDYEAYADRGGGYAAGAGDHRDHRDHRDNNYKRSPKSGNNRSFDGSDGDGDDYSADFNDFENASEDGNQSSGRVQMHPPKSSEPSPMKSILRKPTIDTINHLDDYTEHHHHRAPLRTRDENQQQNRRSSSPREQQRIPSPRRSDDSSSRNSGGKVKMPSTAGATLQAEVVLDEISKEVVRLRNQQRMVLRERRVVAQEKKSRADRRRKEYEETLKRHAQSALAAKRAQEHAEGKSAELETQIKHLHDNKEVVRNAVVLLEKEVEGLKGSIKELTVSLGRAHNQRDDAEKTLQAEKREWLAEKAALEVEVKRHAMMEDSIQERIRSNEARLEEERQKLPEAQEKTLKEREARLDAMEKDVADRESALKITEDLKLTQIEQHRKETMSELNRFRARVESDLAAERQEVSKMRSNLMSSSNQWELLKAEEQSNLEATKMDIVRREAELTERRQEFDKAKSTFDGQVRMMQPTLNAAERDRDDARCLKEQADRVMLAAEEHASSILKAERGLIKREQNCCGAESQLQEARNKLQVDRRMYAADTARQRMMKQALEAERFRLHQLGLELSQQAHQVKRGALVLSKIESPLSSSPAIDGSTSRIDGGGGGGNNNGNNGSTSRVDASGLSAGGGDEDDDHAGVGALVNYAERSVSNSTSMMMGGAGSSKRLSGVSPSMQGVTVALENLLLNTSEPNAELEVLGNIGDGYRNYHALGGAGGDYNNDIGGDNDTYLHSGSTLSQERVSPRPTASELPPPPLEFSRDTSALELLESRLRAGAAAGGNSGGYNSADANLNDRSVDLSSLHKAVQSVSSATDNLGAIATKYGIYSHDR
jgi:hypothetical protein